MKITFQYSGQARKARGTAEEVIDLEENSTVTQALIQVAQTWSPEAKGFFFDDENQVRPSMLIFVNEEQIMEPQTHVLTPNAKVLWMAPLAGG